jgi:NAD(P)-dependent dehydrogenase (short-subunit alcohol dehydrogenase family)
VPAPGDNREHQDQPEATEPQDCRCLMVKCKDRGLYERGQTAKLSTAATVNAILAGPTLSEGLREMLREEQEKSGKSIEEVAVEFVKAYRPSSIIGRAATVEEVANLAVYVASPLSSATTGTALRVDGGVIDTIA